MPKALVCKWFKLKATTLIINFCLADTSWKHICTLWVTGKCLETEAFFVVTSAWQKLCKKAQVHLAHYLRVLLCYRRQGQQRQETAGHMVSIVKNQREMKLMMICLLLVGHSRMPLTVCAGLPKVIYLETPQRNVCTSLFMIILNPINLRINIEASKWEITWEYEK